MEPIETARLIIRPLRAEDAEPIAAIWADPEVTRFMGGPRDYDQVRRSLEEDARADPPPELDLWPVVEKATGRVIGHCGLTPKEIDGRDEVELVYVLARSAWGKGYATEAARALREAAFGRFGLRRLVSLIEPENAASSRVADKAGLRKEKDVLRPGGRWMAVFSTALPSAEGNGGTSLYTHAITRTPGKDFDRGLTSADLGRPDYDLMLRQHAAYVEALSGLGLEVTTLPPLEGFPDGYFVEDPAVILPEVAVITRPGAPSRRGETSAMEAALSGLRPIARILPPGMLEGGDVLVIDRRVFVGLSTRTNASGAEQMAGILSPFGYQVTPVPVPSGLHLKTSVSSIGEGRLLVRPDFDRCPELREFERLVVPPEEARACNTLLINGSLLVPAGFPETSRVLASQGLTLIPLEITETHKMDGGLSCLSLRF